MPSPEKRNQPQITRRGTKRKTKGELREIGDRVASSRDYEDELERCKKSRDGNRTFSDRLSEGFGMMGGQ